ncbi:MAG: glycosyltransferase family 2 protein [Verrucomicrobiota bacterium]
MQPIYDRTGRIKPGDVLLLTLSRDENIRIPHFLQYYRDLGVDHFFFIDNLSIDPVADILASQEDCSLWRTDEPFEDSHWSTDWLNAILPRFAIGHWVLNVDIDEYFVFPFMETRTFRELLAHLDDLKSPSLFSLLIDMYPDGPVEDAVLKKGQHPLEVAPLFDASGYYAEAGHKEGGGVWVRGGPRLRVINRGILDGAPAMNKIPLVKWERNYVSSLGTHLMLPKFLNNGHHRHHHSPTGALLHFKFLSFFREKVRFAVESGNHYEESREYKNYQAQLDSDPELNFVGPVSGKYIDSNSLMRSNLMTAGTWT